MPEETKKVSSADTVNSAEIAAKKAQEMREYFSKKADESEVDEETVEESTEEVPEDSEEEESEQEQPEPQEIPEEQQEEEEDLTEREKALLKEVSRLKADRREARLEQRFGEITPTVEETEDEMEVTKAEARLFTAWRNEALADLLKKYPKYKNDQKLWDRFIEEYEDRVPDLVYAKKKNIPVTKDFFADRLHRVHRSVYDETSKAKEEGKKEAIKTLTNAQLMSPGTHSGQKPEVKTPKKNTYYRRPSTSLHDWISKKK